MAEPLVLKPRAGRALENFGNTLTLKATSSQTGGVYSLIEGVFEPGGFAPLPHIHLKEEESFYVLEGQFDFRIGGATVRGDPGAFLHVPHGTLHGFVNAGDSPARLLFVHAPSLEGFFLELAKLSEAGPSNAEKLATLMRHWGMEVVSS